MSHTIYTGAVIVRRQHREADEILTLWSWERGKVRLLARGVRNAASRLKTVLAPARWLQLHVQPSARLPVVTYARTVERYPGIVGDLDRTACALQIFETVSRTTADQQANHALSLRLRMSLGELSAGADPLRVLIRFRLGLLDALGFGVAFDRCASCGRSVKPGDPLHWDAVQSSAVGADCCAESASEAIPENLRQFFNDCLIDPDLQAPDRQTESAADEWLDRAIAGIIQRPLATRDFWRRHSPVRQPVA